MVANKFKIRYMEPFQGVDRSNWSLDDFIFEGEGITWEAQETEILESKTPFIVSNVHDHFLIWYLELKSFLFKERYIDKTHPAFLQVAPIFDASGVPRIRTSAVKIVDEEYMDMHSAIEISGSDYGDPRSEKSQKLLKNIREETKEILKILRGVLSSLSVKTIKDDVQKNEDIKERFTKKGLKRIYLPKFQRTEWPNVSVRFITERQVILSDSKNYKDADFESLGFADDRTKYGKPDLAWELLLEIANNSGQSKVIPTNELDRKAQHKHRIADTLRKIFTNTSDPFDKFHKTYKALFVLIPPPASGSESEYQE